MRPKVLRPRMEIALPRRSDPIVPFSRLERAAIQALAWELAPAFPQLEGLADEATPGRVHRGMSGFVRRTGLAQSASGRGRGQSGLFGSVHAVVSGLAQPMSFQFQLRRGRLVGLIADAYGQDISGLDFQNIGFDQLFYLDAADRSRPIDPALYRRRDRSQARADVVKAPPQKTSVPVSAPPPVLIQSSAAPVTPSQTPLVVESEAGAALDKTTLKIGIWVGLITIAVVAGILSGGPIFIFGIGAFWIARMLTQPKPLDSIHAALAARQARQMG